MNLLLAKTFKTLSEILLGTYFRKLRKKFSVIEHTYLDYMHFYSISSKLMDGVDPYELQVKKVNLHGFNLSVYEFMNPQLCYNGNQSINCKTSEVLDKNGVYVLIYPDGKLYFGKSNVVNKRLTAHYKGKEGWEKMVFFVPESDNNNESMSFIIEQILIQTFTLMGFPLENFKFNSSGSFAKRKVTANSLNAESITFAEICIMTLFMDYDHIFKASLLINNLNLCLKKNYNFLDIKKVNSFIDEYLIIIFNNKEPKQSMLAAVQKFEKLFSRNGDSDNVNNSNSPKVGGQKNIEKTNLDSRISSGSTGQMSLDMGTEKPVGSSFSLSYTKGGLLNFNGLKTGTNLICKQKDEKSFIVYKGSLVLTLLKEDHNYKKLVSFIKVNSSKVGNLWKLNKDTEVSYAELSILLSGRWKVKDIPPLAEFKKNQIVVTSNTLSEVRTPSIAIAKPKSKGQPLRKLSTKLLENGFFHSSSSHLGTDILFKKISNKNNSEQVKFIVKKGSKVKIVNKKYGPNYSKFSEFIKNHSIVNGDLFELTKDIEVNYTKLSILMSGHWRVGSVKALLELKNQKVISN